MRRGEGGSDDDDRADLIQGRNIPQHLHVILVNLGHSFVNGPIADVEFRGKGQSGHGLFRVVVRLILRLGQA